MAVSKRLRFEVLKRDRHRCYYCGRRAPEWPLTVDHVIPAALGGSDDATNLVAACADCNSGKSSVHPTTDVVADVDRRALLWSAAIKVLAQQRDDDRARQHSVHSEFAAAWQAWRFDSTGTTVPLADDWRASVDAWLASGLTVGDLTDLIQVAMAKPAKDRWRYFCGCVWRTVDKVRTQAYEIADAAADLWDDEEAMV